MAGLRLQVSAFSVAKIPETGRVRAKWCQDEIFTTIRETRINKAIASSQARRSNLMTVSDKLEIAR